MVADPTLKSLAHRSAPSCFPVAFRATPSGFMGMLTVSFIPQLPATASVPALAMASCPEGGLNSLLDLLAAQRGVTFHGRFPVMPAALLPRTNTQWDANAYAYEWSVWIAEAAPRVGTLPEGPHGGPRNLGDQAVCFQVGA